MLRRLAAAFTVSMLCLAERPAAACTGDCDGGGGVSIDELIRGVNIALGNDTVFQCRAFDTNGNESVTIEELIEAVGYAQDGCPDETPTVEPGTPTTVPVDTPTVVSS